MVAVSSRRARSRRSRKDQTLAGAGVTVDNTVSDHDAGGTEAVVVTVDRLDAVVFGGDIRDVDNVLASLLLARLAAGLRCRA